MRQVIRRFVKHLDAEKNASDTTGCLLDFRRSGSRSGVKRAGSCRRAFGVKLHYMDVLSPKNVETAFQAASKARVDAVLFQVSSPLFTFQRPQITQLAVKNRLPVMYERAAEAEAGGLMSYGVSVSDLYRRAATYVDKNPERRDPRQSSR
jgi:ABC-type uncharacterized transport system substrate-binding protein